MALVDYSGSESSEDEEVCASKEPVKPKSAAAKPAFQKVVDSSDPHKIRVNLPGPAKSHVDGDDSERPSKRAKIGSSGLGGFNALLPAPKRMTAPNGRASSDGPRRGGLGSGVSLRTGAAPGFSREPETSVGELEDTEVRESTSDAASVPRVQNTLQSSTPEKLSSLSNGNVETLESKIKGKTTMFKPLSVARKPQKKKNLSLNGSTASKDKNTAPPPQPNSRSKTSLFSVEGRHDTTGQGSTSKAAYQPLIYQNDSLEPTPSTTDLHSENDIEVPMDEASVSELNASAPQSLDTIASDLKLSASAKRQLLGRQKNNPSAINIVNFNTDEEYQANEEARKSGEQAQHNPVRSIAPGKHSLKQLVNMGTMQADALEESFASGRRNRSEAGSKYGW